VWCASLSITIDHPCEFCGYYRKVRVDVFNELETRQITNVFGIIRGREEPGQF